MRQICWGRRGKQLDEVESLGMRDIGENGRNNDKNIWIRVRKRCDIERYSTEFTTRERSSLTLYNR
jgi:hypothetical protein